MKVKLHGIQPHWCVSTLGKKKERRKAKLARPSNNRLNGINGFLLSPYVFILRANQSLCEPLSFRKLRKVKSMSLDTQLRFYREQLVFLLLLATVISKDLSKVLLNYSKLTSHKVSNIWSVCLFVIYSFFFLFFFYSPP